MKHLQYKFDLCLAEAKLREFLSAGLAKCLDLSDNITKQQETCHALHGLLQRKRGAAHLSLGRSSR